VNGLIVYGISTDRENVEIFREGSVGDSFVSGSVGRCKTAIAVRRLL
jgi:DNA helicase IV